MNQLKPQHVFVTGTDTGVGKTYVTLKLMEQFKAQGLKVIGMKPVASGCEMIDGIWQNEDVAKLIAASNVQAPRELVNPYCFDQPIAPHIAADLAGVKIEISVIQKAFEQLCQLADVVIVEGAGGLLVPLNAQETIATLAQALNLPLILVVEMRLGCLNQVALNKIAIDSLGLRLAGWVANDIKQEMPHFIPNLGYCEMLLKGRICLT